MCWEGMCREAKAVKEVGDFLLGYVMVVVLMVYGFRAGICREAKVVKEVGDFLLGEIMVPQSGRPALGLTLHVSQVAAEEMCVAWEGNPPPSSAWPAILDPYCLSVASTTHEGVLHRLWYEPRIS
jgi:hypothetical protein